MTKKTISDVINPNDLAAKKDLEEIYHASIGVYLSYIKPKADFVKMFGQ